MHSRLFYLRLLKYFKRFGFILCFNSMNGVDNSNLHAFLSNEQGLDYTSVIIKDPIKKIKK